MSHCRYHFYYLLLTLFSSVSLADTVIHHDLKVTLQPSMGLLKVEDTLTLQHKTSEIIFKLHKNLEVEATPGVTITPIKSYDNSAAVPVQRYRAKLATPGNQFQLHYSGIITHSLQQISKDYAGDLTQTPGVISLDGVYLSAASYWFPRMDGEYLTFSMQAKLPEGWQLVSQGQSLENGWAEYSPQNDIYIIAAPYQVYQRKTPIAEAMVYLRHADPTTAARYLDATEHYLTLYSQLLGPYPYAKFALVENFWETGYGMPSFTLLGPTVIRLPFIIHTSYPHEILHNWWGNGVYPDYRSGNWSEGLTSYLADHLLQEQRGMGANYRRTTLQRYADSVGPQKDFPLTAFRGRHGQASQAIGYGKTMMFFHMLRQQLGDKTFIKGLRYFYKKNLFKVANFDALRLAFEYVSEKDLSTEFKQWTTRIGAPALQLNDVAIKKTPSGYNLTATIMQTQAEPAFRLNIPILIQEAGKTQYTRYIFSMDAKQAKIDLHVNNQPLRIKIDPQFDLFRRLDPSEIPSSLAQLFGADQVLIVLPSNAPEALKSEYKKLAEHWANRSPALQVRWDSQIKQIPTDRAIWLFGQSNELLNKLAKSIEDKLFSDEIEQLMINRKVFPKAAHSFAISAPNPLNKKQVMGWLSADSSRAISHLGRKLPHYKKYSYLVFKGDKVKNIFKGQWPLDNSALSITIEEEHAIPEIPLTPHQNLAGIVETGSVSPH